MRSILLLASTLILALAVLSSPSEVFLNYIVRPDTTIGVTAEQYQMLPYVEPRSYNVTEKHIVAKASGGSKYLRLIALDVYTGRGWTISEITLEEYPETTIIAYRTGVFEDFEVVLTLNPNRLPRLGGFYIIPYPQPLIVPEGILYIKSSHPIFYEPTGMLFGSINVTRKIVYGIIPAFDVYPRGKAFVASTATLRDLVKATNKTIIGTNRELTLSITPRVYNMSKEIYAQFENRTLGELLLYIRNFLAENIKYSKEDVEAPPGKDLVDYFLFERKKGTCIHYASAAAIILRLMGLRTRVVVGYLGEVLANGTIIYREPGHMWVEILIPYVGWVPYEPSPEIATATESFRRTLRSALENIALVEGNFTSKHLRSGRRIKLEKLEFENETYTELSFEEKTLSSFEINIWDLVPYILLGFIVLAYSTSDVKVVFSELLRLYREERTLGLKFKKFLKNLGRKYGLTVNEYETPREVIEKICTHITDLELKKALLFTLEAYERLSYGKGSVREFYSKLRRLYKYKW
ncbi:MAG: hypothetical protein DRN04_14145 [Thermoprotei archaeon]|nr:MAG: hypothetical protein DRN04_14145 [Thermoprotei archaeon]